MAATLDVLEVAKSLLGDKVKASHQRLGEPTVIVAGKDLRATMDLLRADASMKIDFLADLTAVDWLALPNGPAQKQIGWPPPHRFETIYQLASLETGARLRVCAALDDENPTVASLADLWDVAHPMEREVWDMFGIKFTGHPNLKRIFMHENFDGHPLRKDYPIDRRQGIWAPVDLLGYTPADLEEMGQASDGNPVVINLGPSHPAMHGVYRVELLVHHETILKAEGETGYLHRGFEKSCEKGPWNDPIPYVDRLNYVSALMNDVGYCMAVEKLMGIEVTER